jgi:uncharacterized protein YhaN
MTDTRAALQAAETALAPFAYLAVLERSVVTVSMDDCRQARDALAAVRAALADAPADYRYWEGRYRDAAAERDEMVELLVAIDSGYLIEGQEQELLDTILDRHPRKELRE